uniref:Putative reverse transcriptase, intron maturase and HNH endonuclease n=1 Tax=Jenufa minuta TaxID=993092 RepID=A0A0S2LNM8_JENMI|nr:putative reverse transcriptase, intron maturase and HNH endonuclease [Jenufa minuta]ALO63003.1 putative reverse transcriptase, intron maturase and HNH endonuclease [Jenufa minuta]
MDMNFSTFVSRLSKIRELNASKPDFVNRDLYKLLYKESSLLAGYEKIKSNKGATTPAIGKASLDKFSIRRLTTLSKVLANESWSPSPARRIYIPKPGKVEKRPLGIQGPEEKIVQSTMTLLLEAIYEPIYSPFSFGFRPNKGVHNALKIIDNNYDGMTYAIEGDIKGMYDNVNHHMLVSLLCKKIDDDRFIRLVWKFLRAGYMDERKYVSPTLGTPQGSIVSPILANIYLHEFDLFMTRKSQDVIKRNPKIRTPAYKILDNKMRRIKYNLLKPLPEQQKKDLLRDLRLTKIESLRVRMYCDPSDRVVYTRYADDFIVGIAGSLEFAEKFKEEIRVFLGTLSLTLYFEKTKVTDLRKDYAFFLGHRISIDTRVKISQVRPKGQHPHLKRVTGRLVSITAPIERMVSRLHTKGFCNSKGKPTHKVIWATQEDNQIISLFNVTFRGIFGFYSGVHKRYALSRINYILKYSCALTLAYKHRISLAKVFNKYGSKLSVSYGKDGKEVISLFRSDLTERKWQLGKKLPDPFRHIAVKLAKTKIYENCCICGARSAEMHHVRHLKDSKPGFTTRIMGLINRKQIPVCLECHDAIHAGRYDGIRLREFVYPEVAKR